MNLKTPGLVLVAAAGAFAFLGSRDADAASATVHVYKSPTCGCCVKWVDHLRAAGFEVTVEDVADMGAVKAELGVPYDLGSCHTALVGDYLIEGHVPATTLQAFLDEAPAVKGLAVPGMPIGSPGMEGPNGRPYDVLAFDEAGNRGVFERITP